MFFGWFLTFIILVLLSYAAFYYVKKYDGVGIKFAHQETQQEKSK